MKEQKVLAARIKELCDQKRVSYYVLSYKSTVPMTTLMHIMNCTTKNPGIFTIMKLCEGLNISVEDFFDCDEFRSLAEEMRNQNKVRRT